MEIYKTLLYELKENHIVDLFRRLVVKKKLNLAKQVLILYNYIINQIELAPLLIFRDGVSLQLRFFGFA